MPTFSPICIAEVMTEFLKASAKKTPDSLDLKAVDALVEDTPLKARGNLSFLVAVYLSACDRHDEAKPYWQAATRGDATFFWWKAVAESALRSQAGGKQSKAL